MIGKLTGKIDSISKEGLIVDVGGVGYVVFASALTQRSLMQGQPAVLWIETQVREDHIHLFGFLTLAERDWFRLLTGVQGVGGRVGLAILSVLSPDDIAIAIAAQDKRAFGKADGVGPKLATRLVTELRDKAPAVSLGSVEPAAAGEAPLQAGKTLEEAVSALENLGFDRSSALSAVTKARKDLPAEKADQLDALLPGALKELAG